MASTPVCVIHYHEIALKGGNRERFEYQLIENIRWALRDVASARVQRMSGRIALRFDSRQPTADSRQLVERMLYVFGIANIQVGDEVRQEREGLLQDVVATVRERLSTRHFEERGDEKSHTRDGRILRVSQNNDVRSLPPSPEAPEGRSASLEMTKLETFAVRVKRGNKRYPATSQELEREIGAAIVEATGLGVDLEHPDLTIAVEIVENTAFVLLEKIAGPGGLPVGVSGRVAVLLSSGFDSPVAAWRMLKRGCTAVLVHFHSYPYTSDASIRNVRAIAAHLAAWQGTTTLVTVPLIDIQKAIMVGAPHEVRVLLYRRAMVRIAERIAREDGAGALVTGENLGQVASQTLPNIAAIEAAATLPVLRPLIGYDKQEIIAESERIGTAEISRQPYDDCCSLFTPAHPATAATASALQAIEDALALDDHLERAWVARERETVHPTGDGST